MSWTTSVKDTKTKSCLVLKSVLCEHMQDMRDSNELQTQRYDVIIQSKRNTSYTPRKAILFFIFAAIDRFHVAPYIFDKQLTQAPIIKNFKLVLRVFLQKVQWLFKLAHPLPMK